MIPKWASCTNGAGQCQNPGGQEQSRHDGQHDEEGQRSSRTSPESRDSHSQAHSDPTGKWDGQPTWMLTVELES